MPNQKTDVDRLEAIRVNRRMSLAELHRRSGVSYSMLKYVRRGEREFGEITRAKVADALECKVEDFTVGAAA